MTNKVIAITRQIPSCGPELLHSKGLEIKQWEKARPPSRDELIHFLKGCQGVISMLSDPLSKDVLEKLPDCQIISNYAVGYNNIDLHFCHDSKIIVTNTPHVLTEATAELTMALLLSLARKIIPANNHVLNQEWKTWVPTGFIGMGLKHKKLGIIGPGRIAYEFAKKCHLAFDMDILYFGKNEKKNFRHDLKGKKVSLENLLKNSDVISIHCPLNDQTRHLIGEKEIKLMKNQVILLNTSRGEVINQKNLEKSLETKTFFGIGLDVTDPEPINKNSPLLLDERVLITPHIGSANKESRNAMSLLCAQNIIAHFSNGPYLSQVKI